MDLLLVIAAFEGCKWPRIDNFVQHLKDRDSSNESSKRYRDRQILDLFRLCMYQKFLIIFKRIYETNTCLIGK